MIPAVVILFVAAILTILVAAVLGKADGYRQQNHGDRGHG